MLLVLVIVLTQVNSEFTKKYMHEDRISILQMQKESKNVFTDSKVRRMNCLIKTFKMFLACMFHMNLIVFTLELCMVLCKNPLVTVLLKVTIDLFQKTVPSGNYYANSAAAAMSKDGWMVSVSDACIMYPRKT